MWFLTIRRSSTSRSRFRQDSDASSAYYDRAVVWTSRGEFDLAIRDLTAAIHISPEAASYIGRGDVWYLQGDIDRMIADYDEAIKLDPDNAGAHYNRGVAWHEVGDLERDGRFY